MAHTNANLACGSVAISGWISDTRRSALVTFSLYQPTALALVRSAVRPSAKARRTRYCSVPWVNSSSLTLAALAAATTRAWMASLKSRLLGNERVAANSNADSTLAVASTSVGTVLPFSWTPRCSSTCCGSRIIVSETAKSLLRPLFSTNPKRL